MLTWVLSALLVLLGLCWVRLRWLHVRGYWARRGVPHEPPHPLLGSLTFLMRDCPAIWFRDMRSRFPGAPYVGFWSLWRPGLLVHSPDLARRILVTDFHCFCDRHISADHDSVGSKSLLLANNPFWSSVRRQLSSTFSAAKMKYYQDIITLKSKEVVKRFEHERKKEKAIDIRLAFSDFSTDAISAALLGVGSESLLGGASPLRFVTREFNRSTLYRGVSWTSIFFAPDIARIFRFKFFPSEALTPLRKLLLVAGSLRGGGVGSGVQVARDLLDSLIKLKQENNDKQDVSSDTSLAQAAILLQGGYETTALTLTFATYELAHHPDVQEKLYEELSEARKNVDEKEFYTTVLRNLTYLNCCIKETLRKYSTMGWLDRVARREYRVDERVTLAPGAPVYVNAAGMHWDPRYFPRPELFLPERFEPPHAPQPFTYLPFGEGPRQCIGKRFGQQALRSVLATLVLAARLLPVPGAPPPGSFRYEPAGVLLAPDQVLLVQVEPRRV
uniref:unspecific monooxygenase n=1 Tax=Zygaena filipendulae TaxID=287375 RepID=A0A286MXN6_9NEOP|nr:cytochrome P450 CYP324C1 [Zygaena filipendulae]